MRTRVKFSLRSLMVAVAASALAAFAWFTPRALPPPSQKEVIALAQAAIRYDGFARARPDGRGGRVVSFPAPPNRLYGPGVPLPRPLEPHINVPDVHVRSNRRCERYEPYNPERHPPPPPPAVTVERGWLERLRDRLP